MAEEGLHIGRKIPSRNKKTNEMSANIESELYSSSSSSSSYLDISRKYPISPKKGVIRTFFTAPSERRRLRRHKSRRILPLNNSSSSSINTDLAYGTGFLKVKKRRLRSTKIRREKEKQRSNDPDTAILALGAGLAAVARNQNAEELKASRRTEIFNGSRRSRKAYDIAPGNHSTRSTRDHDQIIVDEEDWESASEDGSESLSYVDSTLAFGDDYVPRRGKSTVVDPRLFGPANSLHGYVTEPVGFQKVDPNSVGVLSPADLISERYEDKRYEEKRFAERDYETNTVSSRQPLQTVFPIPTSDPTRFEVTRGSVVSAEEPLIVRPGPVPLQQPQPIAPVSHIIYDQASELNSPTSKRSSSYGKSIAGAALAGMAGAAIGSMIATDRSDNKKSGYGSDYEDRRKKKDKDGDRSERRSKRSDKDDRKNDYEGKKRDKNGESPPDERREKRREKRRDSEREDPEERRARRREERRAERSKADRYEDSSGAVEPSVVRGPIDPFQFQVAEDAFPTPDISKEIEAKVSTLRGRRDPSPTVYTVEREPDFSRIPNSSTRDQIYGSPELERGSSYSKDDHHRDSRDSQGRGEPYDREAIHRENEHSTEAAENAAFAAQVAAVAAAGGFRGSRSDRRRGERRGGRNYYDHRSEAEDDQDRIIQEDADRAYRESVIARKAVSKVIRERTPSPDAVDKYRKSSRDAVEEVHIVTPPGMEEKKQPGPYDAPNADFELDRVMNPNEFKAFTVPEITMDSPAVDLYQPSTVVDYDPSRFDATIGRRPLLTLVRPTPSPSPAPFKQSTSPERVNSPPPEAEKRRKHRSRSQSVDDFIIDNKGATKETPTPTGSIFSKAVTWGPNETKHYEVESPRETKDEFILDPPPETVPPKKSGGWGTVAGAIMGAAAGVSMAKSDSRTSPKTKPSKGEEQYEYRGVTVERDDSGAETRQSPPTTGPKPTSTFMPGSFADDIDFTATLAAGLEDSGFDPNIVIDDPTYRKRMSPPGSDEDFDSSYRRPFAETVSDLGDIPVENSRERKDRRFPEKPNFSAEKEVQDANAKKSPPGDEDFVTKLSRKEQKRRDKESRQPSIKTNDDRFEKEQSAPFSIVEEPESYTEAPKLSKKEQKKRDKASRRQDSTPIDQASSLEETSSTREAEADPENYFEPTKKSKSKKSKRNSLIYDDETETTPRDGSHKVSVPIDAFDDIINAHAGSPDGREDWDVTTKKSKRKSKRESDRFDSPSQAPTTIGSQYEADPAAFPLPKSTISDPEPADFPLPASTMSQVTRDEYADGRTPIKSFRDSGIFDQSDRDTRSIVSTGASKYDDEQPRKSKKSRSSRRDDDDDENKSVASAPAYDDYESSKKSTKKSRSSSRYDDEDTRSVASAPTYDFEEGKKGKKNGFFGLFGISSSKSESEKKRDESPKAAASDFEEPKKKKKSKRSSLADSSELYGNASAQSVADSGSPNTNGNGNGHGIEDDDDNDDRRGSRRRHRSKDEKRKSSRDDKDSFLAKAGTLGAGVGLAGVAAAFAAHHLRSEATNTNPDGADVSLTRSFPPSEEAKLDPEINQRPFRPSIDPQYGDLLPLPPSNASSPDVGPTVEDLPQLPDSRPETPESERRISREKNTHLARKVENQQLKSPSHSAIPLRFVLNNRSTPSSPDGARSSTVAPPPGATPDAATPRSRARPTSWDSTKEFKPLYLVEHNRHGSTGKIATQDRPPILKQLENENSPASKEKEEAKPEHIADSATIAGNTMLSLEDQKDVPSGQADTPPSKKHVSRLNYDDDSPTLMERGEPFDILTSRDMALDALIGSQPNDFESFRSLRSSSANADALEQIDDSRTLDTDTKAASPPKTSQEVVSIDPSSAIPLERNMSVQQPDSAVTELEVADEDASVKSKKGKKNKKKNRASLLGSSDPIEYMTTEFDSEAPVDTTTDVGAENGPVTTVLRDPVITQSLAPLEELTPSPTPKAEKDEKKKPGAPLEPELMTKAAVIRQDTTKSLASEDSKFKNEQEEVVRMSDQPELQTHQEPDVPPTNENTFPISTSKPKKAKKTKGSIQNWESEDLSTSISPSGIDEPESVPDFFTSKGKKDKKRSKKSAIMRDPEEPSSESINETPKVAESFASPLGDRSIEEPFQSLRNEENDTPKPEAQSSANASSDQVIQTEQGPDGLAAGYKEDQLALARQLQEEFGSGSSKKSKKGKRKSQSGAQTPDVSTPLREEPSYFDDSQERGRGLEGSKLAEDSKTTDDALDTGYKNEQLELARQLQAEFGSESKKSKKDKKKNRSTSRSATDDFLLPEIGEHTQIEPLAGEPSVDPPPSQELSKGDGLDAGYKEDQLQLARELQASFSSGSKKKKDKKRRSTSQTPTQEPGTPILDESRLALDSKGVVPDTASTELPSINAPSGDGFASGYNEDQLALAKQLKEEFGTKSKPSKKDKKRQTLLRSSTFDEPTSESVEEASNTDPFDPLDDTSNLLEGTKAAESDEGLASAKRSKKEKKKRQSQLMNEITSDSANDVLPSFKSVDLPADNAANQDISESATTVEPEEEFAFTSKKSKKEKKKRQSQLQSDFTPDPVTETTRNLELGEPVDAETAEPEGDFFSSKKSKKDKKKRQSQLQSESALQFQDDIPTESSSQPAESFPAEREMPAEVVVAEQAEEEFTSTSKLSKKEKKKRKSQLQSSPAEEVPLEASKSSVQELESSSRDISEDVPTQNSELQKLEDDLNLKPVSALQLETPANPVTHDAEIQDLEYHLNSKRVLVQESEPSAHEVSGNPTNEIAETQSLEENPGPNEMSTHGIESSIEGVTRQVGDDDPEIQKLEDNLNLNLGKSERGKENQHTSSFATSEDVTFPTVDRGESAVAEQYPPASEINAQAIELGDAESNDQEFSSAPKSKKDKKKDKKKGKSSQPSTPGTRSEEIIQEPIQKPDPLGEEQPMDAPAEFLEHTLIKIPITPESAELPSTESRIQNNSPVSHSQLSTQDTNPDQGPAALASTEADAVEIPTFGDRPFLSRTEPANYSDTPASRSEDLDRGLATTASTNLGQNNIVFGEPASFTEPEPSSQLDPSTHISGIHVEPTLPLQTEPSDEPDFATSRSIGNDETVISEPIPQPTEAGDETLFTTKKSKKEKKKKKGLDFTEISDTTGPLTPAELATDSTPNHDILDAAPVVEAFEDDAFSTPGKKSKKDKKKKRALVAFEIPGSENATDSSTPAEQTKETSGFDDVASLPSVVEPVVAGEPISEFADDEPGLSSGKKSKKDKKKKRGSIAFDPVEDGATSTSTSADRVVESRDLDSAITQPISEFFDDDFTAITKKSKKDKKKKRASIALDLQENDSATGSSTPNEPVVEPHNLESNQTQQSAESSKDNSFPDPVKTTIETSNVENIRDQSDLEPAKDGFQVHKSTIESSALEDVRSVPIEEPTKDNIPTPVEPSRLDVLLSQSVEQPIENDKTVPARSSKLDSLLNQIVEEPNAGDSSNHVEPSKLDNLLNQSFEESANETPSTSLDPVLGFDKSYVPSSQPSEEAADDFVSAIEKKSKKDKKKRKSGLNQQSDADNTGTSTPTEKESGNLDNVQSQSLAELLNDESPASAETLNLQDAPNQPITEPADDEFEYSTSKKSKKDKKKRKSGLNQLQDDYSSEPSTPAEPSFSRDILSSASAEPKTESVVPEEIAFSQPSVETVATEEDDFGISTSKKPKKDKKKRKSGLSQQESVDNADTSTPIEQAVNDTNQDETVRSQPVGENVTPEEDEFGFSVGKKSKKDKKKKKAALDWSNEADIPTSSAEASYTGEPDRRIVSNQKVLERDAENPVEDEGEVSLGKIREMDERNKMDTTELPDSANLTSSSIQIGPTATSDRKHTHAQPNENVMEPMDRTEPVGTKNLEPILSRQATIESEPEDISTSQANLEPEVKEAADDEWTSLPSKKDKKNKKRQKTFDVPKDSDIAGTRLPTGETNPKLDQVNPYDVQAIAANDLGLPASENEVTAQPFPEESSLPAEEDSGFTGGKKSKKDKKKRATVEFWNEPSGNATSTPAIIDDQLERPVEKAEQMAVPIEEPVEQPAADQSTPAEDEWLPSASKMSKKDQKKQKGLDLEKRESLIQPENNKTTDASKPTEHGLPGSTMLADIILTATEPEPRSEKTALRDVPLEPTDADSGAHIHDVNSDTTRGVETIAPAENEGLSEQPITSRAPFTKVERPGMERAEEDVSMFMGKSPKKDKKKRKSLLAAGPITPNDSSTEPETTLAWADETTNSKDLKTSTKDSDQPQEFPESVSEFGNISRKTSKKSKKRGKSEVDFAAAKVVSDELAASSHQSTQANAPQATLEDLSAPPLKRGHFELSAHPEPDLATPDAEGVNPLLRAKFHGDMRRGIPESTTSSAEQKDKSNKLSSAAKLGASVGLGVVAGLAAKFEEPKADTKKSKKGKKKLIDRHSTNEDDLFDNPVLWEGAEKIALDEPVSATEAAVDDGFWTAPPDTPNDEITLADAPASKPVEDDSTNVNMTDSQFATSRDIVDVANSTPSLSSKFLEDPKDASSVSRNEESFIGKPVIKKSKKDQSSIQQTEPTSKLEGNPSELRIPKTRTKNKSPPEPQLQDWTPSTPAPNLSPVVEESLRHIPSVHPERQPPALDPNRDSTLVDESPVPPQRGFDHDYVRDSGVQLRDWSRSPGERKREAVSDQALKRLSWPRVNDDTETVDLARPHEPSIKAELDRHIDDIALGVAAATGAVTSRQFSPAREHFTTREHFHRTPSPGSLSHFEQSHRSQTPRSLGTIPRLHTPEQSRAPSAASVRSLASNLSSATPPLRRSDRQKSGDLRSLSQRSEASSVKQDQVELGNDTEINKSDPVTTGGHVHVKDMADVYDGFGEGRLGSPISPTRPPSMRRRQSMKVLDLEAQLHELAEENRMLSEGKTQAEQSLYAAQRATAALADRDAEIDSLKQTINWLHREVSRLTEVNEGLSSANVTMGHQHNERYNILELQHNQTAKELQELRQSHANVSTAMEGVVQHELENTLAEKNREIEQLYAELEAAKEQIRELQRQILAAKASDSEFLTVRDEDYFDNACQQLCSYVQQWVLRFSKFSDMRACRLTSEISNEKIVNRLDNAVLDGSDVDAYLSDRVKRRDIFMSMTMMMVWEFVFTRYLFGMDREQRQKLKSLEKILAEVGPQAAVHQWRATTLTLLAKREAFLSQREQDTEAVVQEIFNTLSEILPPPSQLEDQIQEQLRKVMNVAVDLSIEMRTQRAEYMMLPPLKPEYDANGDLAHKFPFSAALMNERSGDTTSNEELERQGAVVRVVLFPLMVKKGDDRGEGDDQIVVCPAQVLVAKEHKRRSASGRNVSGGSGVMGGHNASRLSVQSSMPGVVSRDGSPF